MIEELKKKKINCIKDNQEIIINALNGVIDSIYNLTDQYLITAPENGELKRTLNENLKPDEKTEKFLTELEKDAKKYDEVRRKIINKDWNLSLVEIARAGLACNFIILSLKKQKQILNMTQEKLEAISDILMEKTQDINLSEQET